MMTGKINSFILSEQRNTLVNIHDSNTLLRVLFERSSDAMLLLDGDVFVDCNQAAVAMMGCGSKAELLALHPYDISPPFQPDGQCSIAKTRKVLRQAYQQGSLRFEWVHQRVDATLLPVEVLLTALPLADRTLLHVSWRDISERQRTEAALRQSEAELRDHRDHLDELVQARTAALQAANEQLQREIADRREVEQALRKARDELQLLLSIQQAITSRLDPRAILQMVADAAYRLTTTDISTVALRDGEALEVAVAAGSFEWDPRGYRLPLRGSAAGLVIETGTPLLVNDAQRDPRVYCDFVKQIGAQALIIVPLFSATEPIGTIIVANRQKDALGPEDERVLSLLASGAAIALENARLYTQAQQAAAVEERQRLARELHDAVTQTLFSVSLIAEVLPRLWERNPAIAQQRLGELRQLTRSALAEMRTLLMELRPDALLEASLADLIRQLADAMVGRAQVPVSVTIEDQSTLPSEVRVAFYRIAQEALNNIAKHANARHATVRLRCRPGSAVLHIIDDGCGFDMERVTAEHLGLKIMRERAAAVGAEAHITSRPGHGTEVTVVWDAPGHVQEESL